MIGYRDMTFCPYYQDCKKGVDCFRALERDVVEGAERIGLPIWQFSEHPDCFEEKLEIENGEQI